MYLDLLLAYPHVKHIILSPSPLLQCVTIVVKVLITMAADTAAEKVPSQIRRGGVVDEEAQRSSQSVEDFKAKDEGAESDSPSAESGSSGIPIDRLDWDSPEDPGNPQLWPTWKKVFHTAIPALFGFAV
jgi:hypothetical protein